MTFLFPPEYLWYRNQNLMALVSILPRQVMAGDGMVLRLVELLASLLPRPIVSIPILLVMDGVGTYPPHAE